MFTEQKEYVHLVDARTFDKTQTLSFGQHGDGAREPDIGGACFSIDGKSVLVGTERAIQQWVYQIKGQKLMKRKLIREAEKSFRVLNYIDAGWFEGRVGRIHGCIVWV